MTGWIIWLTSIPSHHLQSQSSNAAPPNAALNATIVTPAVAFSPCLFLAASAFNLHYLPAEFSAIKEKFPLVLITPQADQSYVWATLVNVLEIWFWHQGASPNCLSPWFFLKRERRPCALGCTVQEWCFHFASLKGRREGRVLSVSQTLLLLMGFSRFSWVNSLSFVICPVDHFQRIKMLGFVFHNFYCSIAEHTMCYHGKSKSQRRVPS